MRNCVPARWTNIPFELAFTNVTSSSLKLPRGSYSISGDYPVIDQGEDYIGGYTNDERLVHPGPLPVVVFGDHTRAVKFVDRPFVQGADGVKVLAPSAAMTSRFAYWALSNADIPSRGYARHYSLVRKLSFPLPPLPEQNRIVEAIESYLTRLDDAVASLERVQRNLERYRASVLKAAVEGRLVPTEAELARQEGRSYEPASVLLERILAERKTRRIEDAAEKVRAKAEAKALEAGKPWTAEDNAKALVKARKTAETKYKEPAPPDTTDLPELPAGWCWTSLGQLAWLVKDGPHYSPKYADEGIPFITGGNVRPEGVDFDSAKRISPELHSELCARIEPQVGDILYTKGGTTGIARVNTYERAFNVWVHVAVLRLADSIEPLYVQNALNSPWCYAQSQRYTHGVGNQDLGLTRMVNITVPLPPLPEQERINATVALVTSVLADAEDTIRSAETRSHALRQSILKWAFEGKLVEQNPNDEPASALLERIRSETASPKR